MKAHDRKTRARSVAPLAATDQGAALRALAFGCLADARTADAVLEVVFGQRSPREVARERQLSRSTLVRRCTRFRACLGSAIAQNYIAVASFVARA